MKSPLQFAPAVLFGVLLILAGDGCASRVPKSSVVIPPPSPVPQDPPAVIAPQTVVSLPAPQPIPPGSLPPRKPVETLPEPSAETTPVKPSRRSGQIVGPVRQHEAAATADPNPPAAANPQPSTTPAPAPPAGQNPLVPGDSNLPSPDTIQKRIDDMRDRLKRARSRPMSEDAQLTAKRVSEYLDLAASALARRDLRQAASLCDRAEVLTQDFPRVP